ncbi:MAG: NAD-dependent epimerase/dehydratase family protein [Streptosporangiales bacterium]
MRAVILGGTGAIGGAVAARLAAADWWVDVTGRDPGAMPRELEVAGVRFHQIERSETSAIGRLVAEGADLLVDLLAYRSADVRALLPVMASVACAVLISSRAVYVDTNGRHLNGEEPPWFPGPVSEDTPTLSPVGDDGAYPFTREGYAPSKVAVERVALDSGLPVTVIRPSKVHGRWARNPRTRVFVERILRGDPTITLAEGTSIDHLTAAANTAALIETVAGKPGQRVLNSADPDTPTAEQIVRAIGERLDWEGGLELVGSQVDPTVGDHPWRSVSPMVLDTGASERLGYTPQGRALELLTQEVDWIAEQPTSPR